MQSVLADSGPLIALFDRDDDFHQPVKDFLKAHKIKLHTTWPVLTEVSYMLSFSPDAKIDFLDFVRKNGVIIQDLGAMALTRLIELIDQYQNVPMDLADGSLLVVALEKPEFRNIISIDSDFSIYMLDKGKKLCNLFPVERYRDLLDKRKRRARGEG